MTMLAPVPRFGVTFVDVDGLTKPGIGWKLYTYAAASSTPKATYTDITKGSSNQNPVIMDARGECDLWLDGSYKFILKDDLDQTIWTIDEIRDVFTGQTLTNTTLAGTLTVTSTAVTWSGNPTHSGNHTFSGNVTINGNVQLGNASGDTLRIDSDAITWTNNPTHSGNHTFSGTLSNAHGEITDSFYTPTLTNVANVTSSSSSATFYDRNGASVTVSGAVTVDPTNTTTFTQLGISLPIPSNLVGNDCNGSAWSLQGSGTSVLSGYIVADTVNDRAELNFVTTTDVANRGWGFLFWYRIN
jgi:hypothetical protein